MQPYKQETTIAMMFDLLLFLPCFTCLFWLVTVCLMTYKTRTFHPLIAIFIAGGTFIAASALYISPSASPELLMAGSILRVITGPSLLPICWLYLKRLQGQGSYSLSQLLWMLIPAILGAATIVLSLLAGPDAIRDGMRIFFSGAGVPSDKIINAYLFVIGPVTFATIGIESIIYVILFVRMLVKNNLRFTHLYKFQKGSSLRVPELQSYYVFILCATFLVTIYFPRTVLAQNHWISVILSVLMTVAFFQFGYISLFGAKTSISRDELLLGFRYNYGENDKAEVLEKVFEKMIEEADPASLKYLFNKIGSHLPTEDLHPVDAVAEAPKSPASHIFSAVAKSWDDDSLLSRFENLIFGKQLYLESGLTLVDVAEKLHTNKTYVSRLVNNTYEMPFPDLINTLRVDYAEQYISAHRDARQNEIAQACGFSSASSFNNIFKKVTGMTPKIWLATSESGR